MRTLVIGALAAAGLAGAANADTILHSPVGGLAGSVQAQAVPDSWSGDGLRAISTNYDNWNNPPSALTSVFTAGSDEIADDLHMVGVVGAGLLTNMGINIANSTGASNLTG